MDSQILTLLNKLETKLDKLDDRLDGIEKVQIEQAGVLKEHTRRSTAAEDNLQLLREQREEDKMSIGEQIQPLQAHVTMVEGVGKFIALISLIVGIVGGIVAIIVVFR